ncbi:MAG: ComEC family competence protein [Caulobacteraceae bacterium]|nr:ComEC family competence protein [Caulobacteraceae bacterium]
MGQTDRWMLWAPVAFGGGCAVYLGLRSEPPLWPLLAIALVCMLGAWAARGRGWIAGNLVALMVAALACGMVTSKVRQMRVDAPRAPASRGLITVEGWVVDVDSPGAKGARVLVAPAWIEGLTAAETPTRIRLTLRGETPPPGSAIRVRAILNPPPPPASPGAYDFARDSYFRGVGGVGLAMTEARPVDLQSPPWRLRLRMAVNAFRWRLAERIVAHLGDRTGGVATAMTTGHEAWISPEDTQTMRDSGLAHILSISGLHMVIVGGFVFFAVRLGVAAWPWLALRVSSKKTAAVAGLVAVWGYLVLSGAPAPAERSAMTATVAFVAILVDRRAITMNALAVAAMFVLVMRPESVAQPGFQMSFAATAALIALSEIWPRRIREISAPWPILAVQRGWSWLLAACAASLVAGLATGPFAMQHFNRTAVYGLFANLVVEPLSSLVIMPFLAIGAMLELLGGPGRWALAVAGWGVDRMLDVGRFFASLPGAVQLVPSAPQAALASAFLGILFICLWRGWLRLLGAPLAVAVLLWPRPPAPDLWIAADGSATVVREGREGIALRDNAKAFAVDIWQRRRGLTPKHISGAEPYLCGRYQCIPGVRPPIKLAAWWGRKPPSAEKLAVLCASAEVVSLRAVTPALPPSCNGKLVFDGVDFARNGSIELWRRDGRWLGQWSQPLRGDRPWTRETPQRQG